MPIYLKLRGQREIIMYSSLSRALSSPRYGEYLPGHYSKAYAESGYFFTCSVLVFLPSEICPTDLICPAPLGRGKAEQSS
jgi:hypothetical protein